MKFDLNILEDYLNRGLVTKQDHPTLPLSIYNYSRDCQYQGSWNEITLSCRGLILDNEGNVVTRKDMALYNIAHNENPIRSVVFNMLDGKDYSSTIWESIKPEYEKPFLNQPDEV